ncbi:uncharacterized protein LOC123552751 [Mercenaria mercenaria]|uniref:uncharacterized protein LOC123552751 n=1 Tax=Mercenaria mercenaria TaxID=6596 RepID=UPI00234E722F|nr:uncharacterized protein LOC123552751 [Mercenaria mercenaria]
MDQDLFEKGQYQSVLDELQKRPQYGPSPSSLAEQLSVSNNMAVCKYLMVQEQHEETRKTYCKEFVDILKRCSSVPAREDVLLVELSALYNYIYCYTEAYCNTETWTQEAGIYCQVYKTFTRVCRLMSLQKRKGDILQYRDTKTACFALFDDVLEKLQFGIGKESLFIHVCQCIVILSVRGIMNEDGSMTYKLLDRVKNVPRGIYDTDAHRQQTFCLPMKMEHSQLTLVHRDHIMDVTSFLMGICLCRTQSWEEAFTTLEGINTSQIKDVAQFLSGFCLLKSGRCTESICCLMEVLRSGESLTQRLKARIYNLIGKCFDKLEKCQLSIQMFKEALCADFSYLVPLFNTSLQYRNQEDEDMELECLNLLVTALEMREVQMVHYEGIDLICLLSTEDEDISYVKALYSLSNRSLQLNRYDVAAEKYVSLLDYLKSWKADKRGTLSIPPLLQVHHEAIEALLKSRKYEECITLCDHVLLCYHNNISSLNESSLLSQTLDQSLLSQSQGHPSNSQTVTGKRKLNELSQSQSDEEHFGDMDVIALKYKAAALVKMGDNSGSLVCLQRAIDSITGYRKFRLQQKMKDLTNSHEPDRKRQKMDPSLSATLENSSHIESHDRTAGTSESSSKDVTHSSQNICDKASVISELFLDSNKMLELEHELYKMTAEILESLEKKKDALHYSRLASQIENIKEKL